MDWPYHFTISIPVAAYAFLSINPLLGIAAFLAGWAVDADHFLDAFIFYKRIPTIREFLACDYYAKSKKSTIIFHAYEYAIAAAIFFPAFWPISLNYSIHLFLDTLYNRAMRAHPSYSILYRISKNFKVIEKPMARESIDLKNLKLYSKKF